MPYYAVMRWRRRARQPEQPRPVDLISVSDPALAELFQFGNRNYAGVQVSEGTAFALAAFYRAVSIVSGTIAMLPMPTIREVDGVITRVNSVMDDPGKVVGLTPFEWKQTVVAHQMCHGNAYLGHVFNVGGGLAGLVPIHPLSAQVDPPPRRMASELDTAYRKTITATLQDGSRRTFTDGVNMTHCPALSLDGRVGLSLIGAARNSLGIAIAGDRAAARMFSNGALYGGLAVPAEGETVSPEDAKTITADLNNLGGWENAGSLAVVNRRLELRPWTMSNKDAQFLESRQFQIEEIARWTGVPPHLLMQTDKQTSWGTGVAEQNRGLSKYTLAHWTSRLEQQLSRLLAAPRSVRFDYTEWERPTPQEQTTMLAAQVQAGIITRNEARAALGMAPIDGGDELDMPATPAPAEAVPATTEAATV